MPFPGEGRGPGAMPSVIERTAPLPSFRDWAPAFAGEAEQWVSYSALASAGEAERRVA